MLTIDKEFKDLIPPLSKDERDGLEQSLLNEGCRDPLYVWNNIIVDGHNRYEICTKYHIPYETKEKNFATRDDVKLWMIGNQLSRRNINNYARTTLLSMSDEIIEKRLEARARQSAAGGDKITDKALFPNWEKAVDRVNTTKELAQKANVGKNTASRVVRINKAIKKAVEENTTVAGCQPEELKQKLMADDISVNEAYNKIKLEEKKNKIIEAEKEIAEQASEEYKPFLYVGDCLKYVPSKKYDLLLTDPPYSTDVEDINQFVNDWLYNALLNVKDTGFAYIFIGAYPEELKAYLNAEIPEHITLCQNLIWTYKNTLGNNPHDRYKQNYQCCLFYRGINAPDLNCPLTAEQWAVQEINAPDGRQGDRYHAWQKPIEIAERFIRHSTEQGMTVYDPFACTGTFLLAASKLGRRAYGCEINPENAELAFKRGCVRYE